MNLKANAVTRNSFVINENLSQLIPNGELLKRFSFDFHCSIALALGLLSPIFVSTSMITSFVFHSLEGLLSQPAHATTDHENTKPLQLYL